MMSSNKRRGESPVLPEHLTEKVFVIDKYADVINIKDPNAKPTSRKSPDPFAIPASVIDFTATVANSGLEDSTDDPPCITDSEYVESDVEDEDKEEVSVGRSCTKCGNFVKGHPLPRGKLCQLPSLGAAELQEKQNLRLSKDRRRQKTEDAKQKDRERKKTEEAKFNCNERQKTEEAKSLRRKRERVGKKEKSFKSAWTKPNTVNPATKLLLPSMTSECCDCGASMFPWEVSKTKKEGVSFSKCCSYGTIKLHPLKDPSPKLKELFTKYDSQSKQFLNNIRIYNGLVSMASKGIRGGKLENYKKCKS